MAKIKVQSKCKLYDGMSITFKAPCDGTAVDGLTVSYNEFVQDFTFRDTHGNNLANLDNLFYEGTYIKAILDTSNGFAYLQNADSSGYLEQNLERLRNGLGNEYLWHKTKPSSTVVFGEQERFDAPNNNYNYGIFYSSSYTVNEDTGEISLADPITVKSIENCYIGGGVVGKYIRCDYIGGGKVLLCDDLYWASYGAGYIMYRPMSYKTTVDSFGYVNSPDPAAYPIDDGYEYLFRGKIGSAPQMETGSYVGTGTCGTENPNRLTFPFTPRMVLVYSDAWPRRGSYGWSQGGFIWVNPCTKDKIDYNSSGDAFYLWFAMNDNTLTYNLGAANASSYSQTLGGMAPAYQCNDLGKTYYYIAIG